MRIKINKIIIFFILINSIFIYSKMNINNKNYYRFYTIERVLSVIFVELVR